jgi:zinc protease
MAVLRPWHEKQDTIVYNEGLMIDQVAQAIINRRLEARARAGASYLTASVNQQNQSRSVDGTFVSIQPIDGDWQAALRDVRAVIADALATPPTPEEIAREVAEINVAFESAVQQRALQPGGRLADDLITRSTFTRPSPAPRWCWTSSSSRSRSSRLTPCWSMGASCSRAAPSARFTSRPMPRTAPATI